ncbi:hypothetical protein GQ55_3G448700 [Panicum hallii var. hallii]|uniref:Uncharacterized protein n=1 Tax=Panicum hallii var. hallii TaxID=1504633 RepID=A0A2T7EIE7_9POAL|nr:hypothetical protein GQ55_3G448700 [Panicum hallii var. hallii]
MFWRLLGAEKRCRRRRIYLTILPLVRSRAAVTPSRRRAQKDQTTPASIGLQPLASARLGSGPGAGAAGHRRRSTAGLPATPAPHSLPSHGPPTTPAMGIQLFDGGGARHRRAAQRSRRPGASGARDAIAYAGAWAPVKSGQSSSAQDKHSTWSITRSLILLLNAKWIQEAPPRATQRWRGHEPPRASSVPRRTTRARAPHREGPAVGHRRLPSSLP